MLGLFNMNILFLICISQYIPVCDVKFTKLVSFSGGLYLCSVNVIVSGFYCAVCVILFCVVRSCVNNSPAREGESVFNIFSGTLIRTSLESGVH